LLWVVVVGGFGGRGGAGALVADTTPPVFAPHADIDLTTSDPSGMNVPFTLPAATDNEDPSPAVACDHAPGSKFAVGSTLVTCTATDATANKATTTFTVLLRGALGVGASVPATLALTLGPAANFGAFAAGVEKEYTATTSASVLSTAGDAALSVSDPGHMTNGAFSLPEPLRVDFSKAAWAAPVSNEPVTITFRQRVKATDALRTGTYSRTLTFTLSTTTP
jgi:X-Pro dipeptidyl-peptidase